MATYQPTDDWARRPSKMDMPLRYEVNRASAKGHPPHLVLSHDVEGAYIHFFRGRSTKCGGKKCEACIAGIRRDWRGYLIVAEPRTRTLSLMELTPASMPPIDAYFRSHRTLRGAIVETKRIPELANGRLSSKIYEAAMSVEGFTKPPSIRRILQKLWGLKLEPQPDALPESQIRMANTPDEQREAS